jgi:DNA-binding PadR family transcriptional regulator
MEAEKNDTELVILENIYDSTHHQGILRQRDLAHIAGASLGMTNSILKRLVQKGWITVRKLNSRKVQYAVTPDGVNEIARRSYRYFKRTIKNVVFYRERIEETVSEAHRRGLHSVVLIGLSDLDFIIEHACNRHGMTLLKAIDHATAEPVLKALAFPVYGEGLRPLEKMPPESALYLSDIVAGSGQSAS